MQIRCTVVSLLFVLTNVASFCVKNKGCKSAHAELLDRDTHFTSNEFSKTVNVGQTECCDPASKGCKADYGRRQDTDDNLLLWVDCDTERNSGQAIVACANCNVTIRESGIILVQTASDGRTLATYTCKGTDAALCAASRRWGMAVEGSRSANVTRRIEIPTDCLVNSFSVPR